MLGFGEELIKNTFEALCLMECLQHLFPLKFAQIALGLLNVYHRDLDHYLQCRSDIYEYFNHHHY